MRSVREIISIRLSITLPVWLALCGTLAARTADQEKPVGLIIGLRPVSTLLPQNDQGDAANLATGGGTKLISPSRYGQQEIQVKVGDVVFEKDVLRSVAGAAVTYLFCPEGAAPFTQTLDFDGTAAFRKKDVVVKPRPAERPPYDGVCRLPSIHHPIPATQQDNGPSVFAEAQSEFPELPDLQARMVNLDTVEKAGLEAELGRLEGEVDSLPVRVARAALFDQYHFPEHAIQEYTVVASMLGYEPAWVQSRVFVMLEEATSRGVRPVANTQEVADEGRTLARLVGISGYHDPGVADLRFAHKDALMFEEYLRSERGGQLSGDAIKTLVSEPSMTCEPEAGDAESRQLPTRAALVAAINEVLGQATENDTVILFFAGHGIVDPNDGNAGYILTCDSDPQDLKSTALPMADVSHSVHKALTRVRRVHVYVDVCHSGNIGTISVTTNRINNDIEDLEDTPDDAVGELVGLLASKPKQYSYEGVKYGGGHGAFTYFFLYALNGADLEQTAEGPDKTITLASTMNYVDRQVRGATGNKQAPKAFGDLPLGLPMARAIEKGIELLPFPTQGSGVEAGRGLSIPKQSEVESGADFNKEFRGLLRTIEDGMLPPKNVARSLDPLMTNLRDSLQGEAYQAVAECPVFRPREAAA